MNIVLADLEVNSLEIKTVKHLLSLSDEKRQKAELSEDLQYLKSYTLESLQDMLMSLKSDRTFLLQLSVHGSAVSSPPEPPRAGRGVSSAKDRFTLKVPDVSASDIAKTVNNYYCPLALPFAVGTYTGSSKVQELKKKMASATPIRRVSEHLFNKLHFVTSMSKVVGGSETHMMDPSLGEIIYALHDEVSSRRRDLRFVPSKGLTVVSALASDKSRKEYGISVEIPIPGEDLSIVVTSSEAKGFEASLYAALPQLINALGDAVITLRLKHLLPLDDCVVIGFAVCDLHVVEVCSVHLLPLSWPVVNRLARLDYSTSEGVIELSKWIGVIADWCIELAGKLKKCTTISTDPLLAHLEIDHQGALFFKPTIQRINEDKGATFRTVQASLRLYEQLYQFETARRVVSFPLGTVNYGRRSMYAEIQEKLKACMAPYFDTEDKQKMPDDDMPLLAFPMLAGFSNGRPTAQHKSEYLEKVAEVVAALNEAQVAHLDLRPANLMWKKVGDGPMDMQVIDFEDGVMFGQYPSKAVAGVMRRILQYPVCSADRPADEASNNYFLDAITGWLGNGDEGVRFSVFMSSEFGKELRKKFGMPVV